MSADRKKRLSKGIPLVATLIVLGSLLAGCGEDFENEPRPPVPIELTGVIQPEQLIVSPDRVGAGPISITISNQTDAAHKVTLQGESVREEVGPINPQDTATIQKTLAQGTYLVRADSERGEGGVAIAAASLTVGRPRKASNDRLLLP